MKFKKYLPESKNVEKKFNKRFQHLTFPNDEEFYEKNTITEEVHERHLHILRFLRYQVPFVNKLHTHTHTHEKMHQ